MRMLFTNCSLRKYFLLPHYEIVLGFLCVWSNILNSSINAHYKSLIQDYDLLIFFKKLNTALLFLISDAVVASRLRQRHYYEHAKFGSAKGDKGNGR